MSEFKLDWNRLLELGWRALVFIVAVAIIIVVSTHWTRWEGREGWQRTDDAYLQADLTAISAKVPGYIRDLPIEDYQRVHQGQVLAKLVDDDYKAAVAQAAANLSSAEALSQVLRAQRELQLANIDAARAVVVSTQAQIDQNDRDLKRQRRLFDTGSSSVEISEKLTTTGQQLEAVWKQNRAAVLAAVRTLAVLDAQMAQSAAAVEAARAALDAANINLGYTTITATQDGFLGARAVKPGQLVSAGSQITTLSPIPNVWVIANYKETQLTHMAVGQTAEIRVDTFPSRRLRGRVLSFAPASGAEFALLPPDNATGNFTKIVQRVAVKIVIVDADGVGDRLVPGMSVEASVNARDAHP